ncbi:MAG: glycolate oxidase iron-sulfur subunit [Syntrophus sp. SKADARSKE-3]|nr:glycolate oxidase iron-sulfur subunit [Syntrophus sp. SKADARSKE-3]
MDKNKLPTLLQSAKKMVSPCDRCGTCLPLCPLYEVKGIEATSARGKNAIARALAEGGIPPSREVLAAANLCLLCRACVENCPSKVKTDEAMIDVRQYLTEATGGATIQYRAIGGMLKRKAIVKLAAAALAVFRKLGINNIFPNGMVPEEYTRTHFLTAFAGPGALGRPAVVSDVPVTAQTKVAYFRGCGMEMMFPEAASRTFDILKSTIQPLIRDNVCCGLPHLAHGLRQDFLTLAKKNIRLYEDVDVVVTDCASCGGTLKHLAAYFTGDEAWKDRAAAFSRKVMDVTEYLVKVGYKPRQTLDVAFTYHDPCHLVRGQGIKKEPRKLLKMAGRFTEMTGADTCCGGAGSFHMDYPQIASQILLKKQRNIEATGAAVVVTACPGCLIQLTKAANASGGKFKAMHISQVI